MWPLSSSVSLSMQDPRAPKAAIGLIIAALCLALIPSMPYGYYPLMRWAVCAACVWLALHANRTGAETWVWVWGVFAGIYNPIVPVHATREIWSVVNLATIAGAGCYWWIKASRIDKEKCNGGEA